MARGYIRMVPTPRVVQKARARARAEPIPPPTLEEEAELVEQALRLDETMPVPDPRLRPRDEFIFLLHTAAEIEHSLLVQYLYAAYSLETDPERLPQSDDPSEYVEKTRRWQGIILGIAKEEMGHLLTVQNLLRALGGPLNFEREDLPFRSEHYPFPFTLEPLTRYSLTKYIVAEMPNKEALPDKYRTQILKEAETSARRSVNKVGLLYKGLRERLESLTNDPRRDLPDDDFQEDLVDLQGGEEWSAEQSNAGDESFRVVVQKVKNRRQAIDAIKVIAEQGEGTLDTAAEQGSHFHKFLRIYLEWPGTDKPKPKKSDPSPWTPSRAVPSQPNTAPEAFPKKTKEDKALEQGRITHPRARLWAHLFNSRYRLLLAYVTHFLYSGGSPYDASGDLTPRGFLLLGTFDEMRRLKKIADKLTLLPQHDPPQKDEQGHWLVAGAPFELPYTLNLPDRDEDRWRTHRDVLRGCADNVIRKLLGGAEDANDPFLLELLRSDVAVVEVAKAVIDGTSLPAQPTNFKKVVRMLEEAVRGFDIGLHQNFWRKKTKEQFVQFKVLGSYTVADPGNADGSNLVRAVEGRPLDDGESVGQMPLGRPPLAKERIDYIKKWITEGCPDSVPAGEVGIVREPNPAREPSSGSGGGSADDPPTAPVSWSRVKQILDGAIAAWKAERGREPKLKQRHGSTSFGWETKQQLADAVAHDLRLIDPAKVGNGQGAQTNLVIALRDEDGVEGNGRMPSGGPYLPESEINEIIQWIDANMPD